MAASDPKAPFGVIQTKERCATLSSIDKQLVPRITVKKLIIALVSAMTLMFVGVTAYRLLSPKVVVTNHSGFPIQEVTLNLPTSRVTFGAVEPGGTSTIYYSLQKGSGTLDYRVQVNDIAHNGSLPYSDSGEFGRVIHIEVDAQGLVTVN